MNGQLIVRKGTPQTMLEGMAIQRLTGAMDDAMVEPMLLLLEEQLASMNPALHPEIVQAN